MALLRCDGCGAEAGEHATYQGWEDAARRLGWVVGEEVVLCRCCHSPGRVGQVTYGGPMTRVVLFWCAVVVGSLAAWVALVVWLT